MYKITQIDRICQNEPKCLLRNGTESKTTSSNIRYFYLPNAFRSSRTCFVWSRTRGNGDFRLCSLLRPWGRLDWTKTGTCTTRPYILQNKNTIWVLRRIQFTNKNTETFWPSPFVGPHWGLYWTLIAHSKLDHGTKMMIPYMGLYGI